MYDTCKLQARQDRDKIIPQILRQYRDETGSKNQSKMRPRRDWDKTETRPRRDIDETETRDPDETKSLTIQCA